MNKKEVVELTTTSFLLEQLLLNTTTVVSSKMVRVDKIVSKGKNGWLTIKKIPIGDKYLEELNNMQF